MLPKINSSHGSETRNIINAAIDSINVQGKSIQDLVAEGQLTLEQYAELITIINSNLKSGEVGKFELTPELRLEVNRISDKINKGEVTESDITGTLQSLVNSIPNKINKGEATFNDIDINKGKLLPKHASEELLSMIAGDTPINAVPADGSITTIKLADGATNRSKLGESYSFVGDVPSGTDLKTVTKEGTHRIVVGTYPDFPDGLDKNRNAIMVVTSIRATRTHVLQQIYQETEPSKRVMRLVNANSGAAEPYQKLWVTDESIDRTKLSNNFSFVQIVPTGTDTKTILKEGVYRLLARNSYIDLPEELDSARDIIVTVKPINDSGTRVFQDMYQENDTSQHVSRMVNGSNGTAVPYKVIGKPTAEQTLLTENNLNVFDRYGDSTKPVVDDTLKLHYSAIKNIKIIGLDPSVPVKIWMVCRDFSTWNYRIMMGKYENGAWSSLADTGTSFNVNENPNGPTNISFNSGNYQISMRIDYNQLPASGRLIDGVAITDNPAFIVNPNNVMLDENSSGGGGEAYDQSLNTTDDVKFASVEVGGEIPTGTLSSPPSGLLKGDVWADTTDSAAHPILRVKS